MLFLASILDFSSIIPYIFYADFYALDIEGAYARAAPDPIAPTNTTYTPVKTSYELR